MKGTGVKSFILTIVGYSILQGSDLLPPENIDFTEFQLPLKRELGHKFEFGQQPAHS